MRGGSRQWALASWVRRGLLRSDDRTARPVGPQEVGADVTPLPDSESPGKAVVRPSHAQQQRSGYAQNNSGSISEKRSAIARSTNRRSWNLTPSTGSGNRINNDRVRVPPAGCRQRCRSVGAEQRTHRYRSDRRPLQGQAAGALRRYQRLGILKGQSSLRPPADGSISRPDLALLPPSTAVFLGIGRSRRSRTTTGEVPSARSSRHLASGRRQGSHAHKSRRRTARLEEPKADLIARPQLLSGRQALLESTFERQAGAEVDNHSRGGHTDCENGD
jgi:hypothetical protein